MKSFMYPMMAAAVLLSQEASAQPKECAAGDTGVAEKLKQGRQLCEDDETRREGIKVLRAAAESCTATVLSLQLARCLEKVGRTTEAVAEYNAIANQGPKGPGGALGLKKAMEEREELRKQLEGVLLIEVPSASEPDLLAPLRINLEVGLVGYGIVDMQQPATVTDPNDRELEMAGDFRIARSRFAQGAALSVGGAVGTSPLYAGVTVGGQMLLAGPSVTGLVYAGPAVHWYLPESPISLGFASYIGYGAGSFALDSLSNDLEYTLMDGDQLVLPSQVFEGEIFDDTAAALGFRGKIRVSVTDPSPTSVGVFLAPTLLASLQGRGIIFTAPLGVDIVFLR